MRSHAPGSEEDALKKSMANSHKQASERASFFNLLPSTKKRRIEAYRELPKVQEWLQNGKEVATRCEPADETRCHGSWLMTLDDNPSFT